MRSDMVSMFYRTSFAKNKIVISSYPIGKHFPDETIEIAMAILDVILFIFTQNNTYISMKLDRYCNVIGQIHSFFVQPIPGGCFRFPLSSARGILC